MNAPVVVIGVGVDGAESLTPQAKDYIAQADQLWGSERLLNLFPDVSAGKIFLSKNILSALEKLKERGETEKIILLASGDPNFFGLGSSLLKILPPDELVFIPQVSMLQEAFARARVAWHDAHFTSAHARPLAEVIGFAKRFPKLGILTDPRNTPAFIAEKLLAAGIPDCRVVVFENLGETNEAMFDEKLSSVIQKSFADLNVMLLIQNEGWTPAPFLIRPDNAYAHRNGLITKADVRALCLSRLALRETDVVWDVGAGSGAVSIEMAEQAWRGRVFAIEKDSENLHHIRENIARFGILNVEVVRGEAPSALLGLPAPSAVFIGGSGGHLESILEIVNQFAGCRVVATFTVLENMLQALTWMKRAGWNPSLTQAQFSYGASIADGTRLSPSNPIFILSKT